MRKFLCFFVLVTMLSFLGCNKSNHPVIKGDFSADVILKYSTASLQSYTRKGTVSGDFAKGVGELTLNVPDEISAITFKWGGKSEISFQGLKFSTDELYLPKTAPAQILYRVLCHLTQSGECKGREGELWNYEGCTDGLCYEALVNKEGYVIEISSEELNFSAELSYE